MVKEVTIDNFNEEVLSQNGTVVVDFFANWCGPCRKLEPILEALITYEQQKLLEAKTLEIGKDIPKMWVSRENGMNELSYKEIIQRIYPFVDITTIKEQQKEEKTK